MEGFDLDGTLADTNFAQAAFKSLESIFKDAPVIYTPEQPFVVITARPHRTSQQKNATSEWLTENEPNFRAIYYVSGTEDEIIAAKARIIQRLQLTSFTDNNPDVLAKLRETLPSLKLWRMSATGRRTEFQ